ncbi:type III-B CRISPR module-associated protein Cmr5 [bacterium]|nr:type III-B CRISPR module-associated protein Cmr5 [bacterium]
MKAVQKLIPAAIEAVVEQHIAEEDGKVDKAFNGYVSSFGASIISAGLLPSLVFFSNKGDSKADRSAVVKAIEYILKKHQYLDNNQSLLKKVHDLVKNNQQPEQNKAELNRLGVHIHHAAVALKLALRTFPQK